MTVYSHALVQPCTWGRWRALATNYPVSVHLVIPNRWENEWFGKPVIWTPSAVVEERFRVTPVAVTNRRHWGRYAFRSIACTLRDRPADAIIAYGEEFSLLLHQIIWCRKRFAPQAKLAFFTWNNLTILGGRRLWLKRWLWKRVCSGTDTAMAGNEKGAQLIREAGYPGQVLTQTEIGVDEKDFHPDPANRERVRRKIGAEGFVFGFAGRLTEAKGLEDLFTALENLRTEQPWTLLLVGDGDLRSELERRADCLGGKVVFVGQRPAPEMPDWFRAMDCLVLPSRSMPDWEEQFGLVIPQAALCGALVLGSDSGAIPEVLGTADAVFRERSPEQLGALLARAVEDHGWRERVTDKVRTTARRQHTTTALAAQTYSWLSGDSASALR
ncbi:MAG: glycosyltransferase family 4 protein [Lentisphaeria bacterium]|nr:glycosyltransferase family 4 protein [Lentisphaeria bacterium]